MARRAFLLRLLLSTAAIQHAAAIKCYFHDESVDTEPGVQPAANGTGTTNMCCDSNESFLPNGLCLNNESKNISRRSCTDKNWDSTGCQALCADHFNDQRGEAWPVWPCDGTPTSLTWCCNRKGDMHGECCNGGSTFARYTIAAKLGDPIPNYGPTSSGLSVGAKVGIAIGAVFGVVLLVGVALIAWKFRRLQKKVEKIGQEEAQQSSPVIYRDVKPVQLEGMETVVHEAPVIYRHAQSPEPQELDGSSVPPMSPKMHSPTSTYSNTPLMRNSSIQNTPLMLSRTPQQRDPHTSIQTTPQMMIRAPEHTVSPM